MFLVDLALFFPGGRCFRSSTLTSDSSSAISSYLFKFLSNIPIKCLIVSMAHHHQPIAKVDNIVNVVHISIFAHESNPIVIISNEAIRYTIGTIRASHCHVVISLFLFKPGLIRKISIRRGIPVLYISNQRNHLVLDRRSILRLLSHRSLLLESLARLQISYFEFLLDLLL